MKKKSQSGAQSKSVAQPAEKIISLRDITKTFQSDEGVETQILKGVSFDIYAGEFVSIMGTSGSGKSTLMYILGLLDQATSGTYEFTGRDINALSDDELAEFRSRSIGFIFQSYNLLEKTSVLDNVLLPATYVEGADMRAVEKRARELLGKVGLSHRLNYAPNRLSGGEQQRAAIVRALINQPRLILADEPTGNLDSKSGREIMGILQGLNDEGSTIVLVTHERQTAQCARRMLQIKDGLILADEKITERVLVKNGEYNK